MIAFKKVLNIGNTKIICILVEESIIIFPEEEI